MPGLNRGLQLLQHGERTDLSCSAAVSIKAGNQNQVAVLFSGYSLFTVALLYIKLNSAQWKSLMSCYLCIRSRRLVEKLLFLPPGFWKYLNTFILRFQGLQSSWVLDKVLETLIIYCSLSHRIVPTSDKEIKSQRV